MVMYIGMCLYCVTVFFHNLSSKVFNCLCIFDLFLSVNYFARWDIRTQKCIDKFSNEDGTISSTLSMSSHYLAVGAESGVVNLYDNTSLEAERFHYKRSPMKRIMNLKTSVDFLKFNHNGEILAMSTRREKDNLKILHTKSRTVFSNWPTSKTPLGFVWSLDFSPGSKFMAVGNDKGKCLLYKLNHYHELSSIN